MYCNNCGTKNPEGANFCSVCGARMNVSETNVKTQAKKRLDENVMPDEEMATEPVSEARTVLYGYVNSIITKIENGFDDVATLTPDKDGIPFQIRNWIQISGPLFYGGAKNDDIYVCICLHGCDSDRLKIYKRFGYRKEGDNAGLTKYYKWSEVDKIANEVEEIVVTLVGESKANAFLSDDEFAEMTKRQMADARTTAQRQNRKEWLIGLLIAAVISLLTFAIAFLVAG